MTHWSVPDPEFEARVRDGFARQRLMTTLGASLEHVAPGEVRIAVPFSEAWTQQHGYLHAGIVTTVVDTACGFAAYTLMAPDVGVLTVEFKVNFMNPARGQRFVTVGRVVKAGRTLTVCQGEVHAEDAGKIVPIALMQATMMAVSTKGLP